MIVRALGVANNKSAKHLINDCSNATNEDEQ